MQRLSAFLKRVARDAMMNIAPDLSLQLLSIRSRRLIEKQVRDLGLDEIARKISASTCGRVAMGPFKNMLLDYEALPVHGAPKFVGSYEKEIVDFVEDAIRLSPPMVLNVGTAEGYYAVGFALRLPQARIFAAEADPKALRATLRNARLNGVGDRLHPIGIIHPGELATYLRSPGSLVMMDCEGAEFTLLNPALDPVLQRTHILVEIHEEFGETQQLLSRFSSTHEVHTGSAVARTAEDLNGFDVTMEAVDERRGPQSWLWMKASSTTSR
jgi:hypothetical protein